MAGFVRVLFFVSCILPLTLSRNVANVLVYTYTAGYRHESIPTAIRELNRRGPDAGIAFTNSEDPDSFTDDYLSQFDALFFLSTTGQVLDRAGLEAFQRYLDQGGNFIGVHSASASLYNSTSYGLTIGAFFAYHPDFTNATMIVTDATHPSTEPLPERWNVTDEIYNYTQDPRQLGAVVVLAADETSYVDLGGGSPGQGSPHPIAWYQDRLRGTNSTELAGRSWHSGLGHASSAWEDDLFMQHIMGGVTWTISSGTTRALNSDAMVGSTGPVYEPPPVPTTTVAIEPELTALALRTSRQFGFLPSVLLLAVVAWML